LAIDSLPDDADIVSTRLSLLYKRDHAGFLLESNEPFGPGESAPLVHIILCRDTVVVGFQAGIDKNLLKRFEQAFSTLTPLNNLNDRSIDTAVSALVQEIPTLNSLYSGPVYEIIKLTTQSSRTLRVNSSNKKLLITHYPETANGIEFMQPCRAITVDHQAVSICRTVRIHEMYREAGADTVAVYRKHGYGTDVVAAWASDVLEMGLFPLYSTNWNNQGSMGIARKLNMKQVAIELKIQ
jgi:hypothetical protein